MHASTRLKQTSPTLQTSSGLGLHQTSILLETVRKRTLKAVVPGGLWLSEGNVIVPNSRSCSRVSLHGITKKKAKQVHYGAKVERSKYVEIHRAVLYVCSCVGSGQHSGSKLSMHYAAELGWPRCSFAIVFVRRGVSANNALMSFTSSSTSKSIKAPSSKR